MPLQFYGFWRSIASFRVRAALNLKGLSFEEIPVDILTGKQFLPEYSAMNAGHSVPTLIADGHTLFQSLSILEYLDEVHPNPPFMPKTPAERAYIRSLCLVTVADTHPLFVPRIRKYLSQNLKVKPEEVETWAQHWISEGFATFERLLERKPASPFIGGVTPGLADICVAGHIVSAGFFNLEFTQYKAVSALGERCFALPAFANAHPLKQAGAPKSS